MKGKEVMIYNTSGITYRIYTNGLIILILSIVVLLIYFLSKKTSDARPLKTLIIAICGILFSVGYISYFSLQSINPDVEVCEGKFIEEHRAGTRAPFTNSYDFDIFEERNIRLYLDIFSKKEIFPENFAEGESYRIAYQKDTKIILSVEIVE